MWNSCFRDLIQELKQQRSLCQCLTSSLWTGCGGSAPGSSSASWCHTQRASSGWLPRANRGPPHSWGPSGSTHKAQGPGCSSPQPHLNTTQHIIITAGYRQSAIWVTGYPESTQDCESSQYLLQHADGKRWHAVTLTVKHSEDFLHHLPQDEDVGLSVWWSSRLAVLAVLTQFAEIAFLVFGMGIRCGHVLQTWRPWNQMIQVLHPLKLKGGQVHGNISDALRNRVRTKETEKKKIEDVAPET